MQEDVRHLLTCNPPTLTRADALAVAERCFGISGTASPLVGDRDQNFRLQTGDGQRYALKISNPAEQAAVVDFQNRALLHVAAQDPALPVPRVIPCLDGTLHKSLAIKGTTHIVRMLGWLDGIVLDHATPSAQLKESLGKTLARLDRALEDFDHPGSNPPLLWDMKRAGGLRDLLGYVEQAPLKQEIRKVLDRFESHVQPTLGKLRKQVIYNDLNLDNVLVDPADPRRIVGIIDFGDLVMSAMIIDLAVAAAYQLADDDNPLAGALPMIAAYHGERPLTGDEMAILPDLIRTRLISSILINSYRVSMFPENREYLMVSFDFARNCLRSINKMSQDEAFALVASACEAA